MADRRSLIVRDNGDLGEIDGTDVLTAYGLKVTDYTAPLKLEYELNSTVRVSAQFGGAGADYYILLYDATPIQTAQFVVKGTSGRYERVTAGPSVFEAWATSDADVGFTGKANSQTRLNLYYDQSASAARLEYLDATSSVDGYLELSETITEIGSATGTAHKLRVAGGAADLAIEFEASGVAQGQVWYDLSDSSIATQFGAGPVLAVNATQVDIDGNRVLTTADEGTGNGLDADTLDSIDSLSFLRSDTADEAAGAITFSTAPILNNTVFLTGKETGGTARNLIGVDGSNNVLVGALNDALTLQSTAPITFGTRTFVEQQSTYAHAVHPSVAAGSGPWIEVLGSRQDANSGQSFGGKIMLAQDRGTYGYHTANQRVGSVCFGYTDVPGTYTTLYTSASICGYAPAAHSVGTTTRPLGLRFYVGSTARGLYEHNVTFGDNLALDIDHNAVWLVNDFTHTSDGQCDLNLFGDGTSAQAGLFSSALNIFGGGSQTRRLQLAQDYNGDSIVASNYSLRIDATNGLTVTPNSVFNSIVRFDESIGNGNTGTAQTITWSNGNLQKSTLTGNCTYTFVSPGSATWLTFHVTQDATGGRTITWPATVKWPGGGSQPAVSTVASTVTIYHFYFDGTNYRGFADVNLTRETLVIAASDESTALTTGTAKVTFRMPWAATLIGVRASVTTAPTGATLNVDINESGTSVLSTILSIDVSEKTSTTAATPAVISDTALADDAEMTIDIDQIGSTVAGAGLKVYLDCVRLS